MNANKGNFFVSCQGSLGEFQSKPCLVCGSTSTAERILQGDSLFGEVPTRMKVCGNGHPMAAEQKPSFELSKGGLSWGK